VADARRSWLAGIKNGDEAKPAVGEKVARARTIAFPRDDQVQLDTAVGPGSGTKRGALDPSVFQRQRNRSGIGLRDAFARIMPGCERERVLAYQARVRRAVQSGLVRAGCKQQQKREENPHQLGASALEAVRASAAAAACAASSRRGSNSTASSTAWRSRVLAINAPATRSARSPGSAARAASWASAWLSSFRSAAESASTS